MSDDVRIVWWLLSTLLKNTIRKWKQKTEKEKEEIVKLVVISKNGECQSEFEGFFLCVSALLSLASVLCFISCRIQMSWFDWLINLIIPKGNWFFSVVGKSNVHNNNIRDKNSHRHSPRMADTRCTRAEKKKTIKQLISALHFSAVPAVEKGLDEPISFWYYFFVFL